MIISINQKVYNKLSFVEVVECLSRRKSPISRILNDSDSISHMIYVVFKFHNTMHHNALPIVDVHWFKFTPIVVLKGHSMKFKHHTNSV